MIMNSYDATWIHMLHFMTHEFLNEFMYMENIVKSYLKSYVSRFQMSTAWQASAAIAHLLRGSKISLILASYVMALPSACKKPSQIA